MQCPASGIHSRVGPQKQRLFKKKQKFFLNGGADRLHRRVAGGGSYRSRRWRGTPSGGRSWSTRGSAMGERCNQMPCQSDGVKEL